MALIYHNITPPEYFIGVHRTLVGQCFRGRRELRAYVPRCDLALGDSEFNRQDLEAPRLSQDRRAAGRPGLLASRSRTEPVRRRSLRRRLDEHPVRRPRDREQEDRERDPLLSRVSHDVQPAVAPDHRRHVQPVRTLPRRLDASGRGARTVARALHRPHFGRGAGRLLRDRRPVPVRERARRILRPAGRGVLQAGAGARLRRHRGARHDGWRRRPVRRHVAGARRAR